jgi:hypothetical protein
MLQLCLCLAIVFIMLTFVYFVKRLCHTLLHYLNSARHAANSHAVYVSGHKNS